MSLKNGLAAMKLHMPKRIPHTEYPVEHHWPVLQSVTGLNVDEHSSPEEKHLAN